mmetsp:Transcript_7512/g.26801  ORF Transcript_7512/g.26801 Transcript_7512/m.26801 type:complete len:167 (-) Transcript_7512:1391-1891(-)
MPTTEMKQPCRAFGSTSALSFFDVMQRLRFCGARVADQFPTFRYCTLPNFDGMRTLTWSHPCHGCDFWVTHIELARGKKTKTLLQNFHAYTHTFYNLMRKVVICLPVTLWKNDLKGMAYCTLHDRPHLPWKLRLHPRASNAHHPMESLPLARAQDAADFPLPAPLK